MKQLIATIIALSFTAATSAQSWSAWDNPSAPFDATTDRVYNGSINIEWQIADDVNKACESASRKYGNSGFGGKKMHGCAFWWGEKCVIITTKKPTMHTVGHEIRHCFYGGWH